MPISATSTRPACSFPGLTCSPTLEPWKVAVAAALTASASTSPGDAFTPDGTSQGNTRASRLVRPRRHVAGHDGRVLLVDRPDGRGHRLARLALEAGAEQRVHDRAGPGQPPRGETPRGGHSPHPPAPPP